jgi:hypothetical protein
MASYFYRILSDFLAADDLDFRKVACSFSLISTDFFKTGAQDAHASANLCTVFVIAGSLSLQSLDEARSL